MGSADLAGAVHLVENRLKLIRFSFRCFDYFLRLPVGPIIAESGTLSGEFVGAPTLSDLANIFARLLPLPVTNFIFDSPPKVDPLLWRKGQADFIFVVFALDNRCDVYNTSRDSCLPSPNGCQVN